MDVWDRHWEKKEVSELIHFLNKPYDTIQNYTRFQEIEMMSNLLKEENISLASDVGCGLGQSDIYLRDRGIDVIGIDVSKTALEKAKEFHNSFQLAGSFITIRADIKQMPFRKSSFDLLWNYGVLEHFKEKDQVGILKEMVDALKRGRLIIIFVPNLLNVYSIFIFIFEFLKKIKIGNGWVYGYERPMSIRSLLELIRKNDCICCEYCGGIVPFLIPTPKFTPKFINRFLTKISEKIEDTPISKLFGRDIVIKLRRVK